MGKEDTFTVKARGAGQTKLACSVSDAGKGGSSSTPVLEGEVQEQENQQFDVKLVPKEIGKATVHLKWAGVDIPRSPFNVNVCDASKASISGLESEGRVGEPVTFKVIAKEGDCGSGLLKVVPRGPSANYNPDVKTNKDGTHYVSFIPWEVGPHKIDVEFGGGKVPKSPVSMSIVAAPDAKTCSAAGKGLKKAIAGAETQFQILSPESGLLDKTDPVGLEVAVLSSSPKQEAAPSTVKDNQDGSYTVLYTAPTPGDYEIAVRFYGKHIPGSPFRLDVVPSAEASQCRAYGPALHPNSLHIAGNPLDMSVDTTKAGTGDLQVVITGPDESRPKVYVANEDGIYSIKWNVQEAGRYQAHVWWTDQYIPGSPFKIKVSPGPNAGLVKAYGPGLESLFDISTDSSDFTIETKEAGIGTLTIRVHGVKGAFKIQAQPASEADLRTLKALYHPRMPGDYIIAIRWSGSHVPGSPFKITIREPSKPSSGEQRYVPAPPKIYMSHIGDSEVTEEGETEERGTDDIDSPEPTPLSKVNEKKNKKKAKKGKSQTDFEDLNGFDPAPPKSAVSLPLKSSLKNGGGGGGSMTTELMKEQQLEMLRQRGIVHVAGQPPPVYGGGGGFVQMVRSSSTSETVTTSSTSEGVRDKRKKKKKF